MANEITVNMELDVANAPFSDRFRPGRLLIDQAAVGVAGQVYEIGTSEEVITFTDIGTKGWLWMHNLDAANFVQWGPESGGAMVAAGKLMPGEPAMFRADPTLTLRLKADTAACNVLVKVLED